MKCSRIEDAHRVLEHLPTHNVVSWGAMIVGFTYQGKAQDGCMYVCTYVRTYVCIWSCLPTMVTSLMHAYYLINCYTKMLVYGNV